MLTPEEEKHHCLTVAAIDQMLAAILDGSEEALSEARAWLVEVANGGGDEVVVLLRAWRLFLEAGLIFKDR